MSGAIYDRWGSLVFSSESIPFTWDVLFSEKEVLPGAYVYTLKVNYLINSIEQQTSLSGDITVVK
jgi:hypothetical protein